MITRTRFSIFALAAGAALFSTFPQARAQDFLRGVVVGEDAYVLGTAEQITPSRVTNVLLSPLGRYVLVAQQEVFGSPNNPVSTKIAGGGKLLVWNSRTGRASTIWEKRPSPDASTRGVVRAAAWLPQTDNALAVVGTEPLSIREGQPKPQTLYSLLLIDASRGSARTLYTGSGALTLAVSPQAPVALVTETVTGENGQPRQQARVISERGILGPVLPMEPSGESNPQWDQQGLIAYQKAAEHWYAVDMRSLKVTLLDKKPELPQQNTLAKTLPLQITASTGSVSQGKTTQPLRPLWLSGQGESALQPALLSPHAERGFLLPDLSAALYTSDGALYFVPILRTTKLALEQAREAALRAQAMTNAFETGHALLAYAAKNDGRFPASNNFAEALGPYLRTVSFLNNPATNAPGLTLVFNGNLSSVQNPGETILGYLVGPGGQAVIYANGDIKWKRL